MFTKNVDQVLRTFTKAIQDLETIEIDQEQEIVKLEEKLLEASEERGKALRVLKKLKDLVE